MDDARVFWLLDQRISYLEKQQIKLRETLNVPIDKLNYDHLQDFMENIGRLRELRHLRERMENF